MPTLREKALTDIVSGNTLAYPWFRREPGVYQVVPSWATGEMLDTNCVTNADLLAIDSRLVEVVEEMSSKRSDSIVTTSFLNTTYAEHWSRSNLVLDVKPGENVYYSLRPAEEQPKWYILGFATVTESPTKDDIIEICVMVYRTERTASGIEYVAERQDTWVERTPEWLDGYVVGGCNLIGMLRAMGEPCENWAGYLQSNYIPLQQQHIETTYELPEFSAIHTI